MSITKKITSIILTIIIAVSCFYTGTLNSEAKTTSVPKITYQAHIADDGWLTAVSNGKTAGSTGQSKRMEAIKINLKKSKKSAVTYRVHVQNIGWMDWVNSGEVAGTTGQSLQIEAVQIKLTGTYAKKYDIYYRVHVAGSGWLSWTKNGATAGSTGSSIRTEALEIKIVPKNSKVSGSNGVADITKPSFTYKANTYGNGWMSEVSEGKTAGTTGQSKRMEGLIINLTDFDGKSNGVTYQAHVANVGWESWKNSGQTAGSPGSNNAIEAVKIKLCGELAKHYNIYYRLHVADKGWLGWASNGAAAGTTGSGTRAEAIEIKLVAKSASFDCGGTAYYEGSNKDKTLNVNWDHIAAVGKQEAGSVSCWCFANAYCRTIIDGYAHSWAEYDANGGYDQDEAASSPEIAGYHRHVNYDKQSSLKDIYDSINKGYPVVVNVSSYYAKSHFVAVIGYTNVTNENALSESNFLIIDSIYYKPNAAENMGGTGYSILYDDGYHYYTAY